MDAARARPGCLGLAAGADRPLSPRPPRVSLGPRRQGSAQDQHWNVRVCQHLLGFTAQQQAFDAFAAV